MGATSNADHVLVTYREKTSFRLSGLESPARLFDLARTSNATMDGWLNSCVEPSQREQPMPSRPPHKAMQHTRKCSNAVVPSSRGAERSRAMWLDPSKTVTGSSPTPLGLDTAAAMSPSVAYHSTRRHHTARRAGAGLWHSHCSLYLSTCPVSLKGQITNHVQLKHVSFNKLHHFHLPRQSILRSRQRFLWRHCLRTRSGRGVFSWKEIGINISNWASTEHRARWEYQLG